MYRRSARKDVTPGGVRWSGRAAPLYRVIYDRFRIAGQRIKRVSGASPPGKQWYGEV